VPFLEIPPLGRPIISFADSVIVRNAPFDTGPYFNPLNMVVLDTNVSIKWNPEAGTLPPASNKMTAISQQAGNDIASQLTNIEPAAGGNGGQGGNTDIDCANNFLDNRACAQ
jgi:hypothetical protein